MRGNLSVGKVTIIEFESENIRHSRKNPDGKKDVEG